MEAFTKELLYLKRSRRVVAILAIHIESKVSTHMSSYSV